jgi:hypothetical protein
MALDKRFPGISGHTQDCFSVIEISPRRPSLMMAAHPVASAAPLRLRRLILTVFGLLGMPNPASAVPDAADKPFHP